MVTLPLKPKTGVTTNFLYDIRNQLGEVKEGVSILGRYGYDYEQFRVLKIGDGGLHRYTYDQSSVITESNQANATVSKYDYGLDQLVRLDNTVEGRSFFHLDILGSTVSLTEDAGSTRQSIFYDAWGNERDRVGASANKFTFTGHEKDEETGLIYAKSRFYDPDTGRFLTQDSFLGDVTNVPSLHRYVYANVNPLRFIDRTGRQSEEVVPEERGSMLQSVDEFWINWVSMRIPSEFEMRLWSIMRQMAGGDSLFETVKEQAKSSLPPTNVQPNEIFLIDGEEAEKIRKNRELAEDAFEAIQTIEEIRKALDRAQEENLRDSSPRVVEEGDDGAYLSPPTASFDPKNPRSGKVDVPPGGVTTTRNERGELVVVGERLENLVIKRPNKPIRARLPFEGDSPIHRLPDRGGRGPTQGILVVGDTEIDYISGEGGMSQGFADEGVPGFTPFNETHVEAQAAATMREAGIKQGTLYINHEGGPCRGNQGCLTKLDEMLPEGGSLKVVWPDGKGGTKENTFGGKQE